MPTQNYAAKFSCIHGHLIECVHNNILQHHQEVHGNGTSNKLNTLQQSTTLNLNSLQHYKRTDENVMLIRTIGEERGWPRGRGDIP